LKASPENLQDSEPSMSPPTEWVERLFAKLLTLYGTRFADMWRGVAVEDVKKTWGAALARYPLETIRDALVKLTSSSTYPPTLPEFVALCESCYRPAPQKALTLELPPPDPEAAQKMRALFEKQAAEMSDKCEPGKGSRKWAYDVLERAKRGEGYPLTQTAVQIAEEAVRIDRMLRAKPAPQADA
jgi:hypothetical protein